MSKQPQSLADLKHFIREVSGHTWVVSIRARTLKSGEKYAGYHAGYKEIYGPRGAGDKAYSVRRRRDKRARNLKHGLASENASSAMDVTVRGQGKDNRKLQREFTAWIVKQAKAKKLDIQFVGGPDANGVGKVWEKPHWKPVNGPDKDHTHISFPRDTEFDDRTTQFKPYFVK